ncbi:MAG: radical SAM protein [Deltaproteobacteria bacterium]|nr:radical SAM protein [Deltaproteobacteria bacterium]
MRRRGSPTQRLLVALIRPTKYDDDGYLVRHLRGVLPSNSLACLHALTLDAAHRRVLGTIRTDVLLCDESVRAFPRRRFERSARRPGTRTLVALVGVQTSQFPRAADLALRFRHRGCAVLLGGFHVSGALAMLPGIPADLRALRAAGVTLVAGEIEATWDAILRDAAAGRLAETYDTLGARPALASAPVPRLDRRLLRRFVHRGFGTLETSRGCPFACSFCTVINVQGRTMRARDPDTIGEAVVENFRALGTTDYFFTDDDFARNPRWREVLDVLRRVRRTHGIPLRFLMQADLGAHRLPGFVDEARRAGCFQVFLGMESLAPENLAGAGKRQNRTGEYAAVIERWRDAGVLTHVGYIVGFPHDTADRVRAEVIALRDEIRPDLASFFMWTPLPGSRDHRELVARGTPLDRDWNRYDTFHAVLDHPRMTRAEWQAAYADAWRLFYAPDAMRRTLADVAPELRITLLQLWLWYRSAIELERAHPMVTGFWRLKPRRDRRPGCAIEGRWTHAAQRARAAGAALAGTGRVLGELHRLWTIAERSGGSTSWPRFLRAMFRQRRGHERRMAHAAAPTIASATQP